MASLTLPPKMTGGIHGKCYARGGSLSTVVLLPALTVSLRNRGGGRVEAGNRVSRVTLRQIDYLVPKDTVFPNAFRLVIKWKT